MPTKCIVKGAYENTQNLCSCLVPVRLGPLHLLSHGPLTFYVGTIEIDVVFTNDKRYRAEEILAEGKKIYHFQLFGSVSHGWTVRGDLDNSDICTCIPRDQLLRYGF